MAGKYTPEDMQEWKKRGYTAQNVMDWYGYDAWGAYSRFLSAPYSGSGIFNYYPVPNTSGSFTPAWTPTYSATQPSSTGGQPSTPTTPGSLAGGYTGSVYTGQPTANVQNQESQFQQWMKLGYTPDDIAFISPSSVVSAYSRYLKQAAVVDVPSASDPKLPAGGQPPAYSYTGPRSGGWASQPNGQAPIAFTDAQWAGLNAPSWSPYYADHSQYMTADGVMHNSQYNYVGRTMGEANTQAVGNDQLNRYGQALGTLGPLNNRNVMGRRRSAGNPLFQNHRYGNGPAGPTQNNPTRLPPNITPHNSNGGGGGGGTYTGGTYNDLINWRI